VRTGSEVPNDAIVKGYELPSGEYVLINDTNSPRSTGSRAHDRHRRVRRPRGIDPIFYDSAYYLRTRKATVKPYALLAKRWSERRRSPSRGS